MNIKKGKIGNALESVAPNHVVAEASAIYDQDKEKYQGQINAEVDAQIFDADDPSTNTLIKRVQDVEALGQISVGPVESQIATDTDFDDPTAEQRAKVPTVGAILDGFDPDGAYDVTARNAGSPTFESLDELLSDENLATLIPEAKRHGGMSIKFVQSSVQSSDNKYVQYRLMKNAFSITATDWQGVDDKPIPNSVNLVQSGGVAKSSFANVIDVKGYNAVDFEIKTGAEHSVFDGITLKKNTEYIIVSSIDTAKSSTVYIAVRYTDNGTPKSLAVLNIPAGSLTNSVSVVPQKDLQNCRIEVYCGSYVASASVSISIVDFELKEEDSIGVLKIDHNHYFANGYINTDGSISGTFDGISIHKESLIKVIPGGKYKIDNPLNLKTGYATYGSDKVFKRLVWYNDTNKISVKNDESYICLLLRRPTESGGLTPDIFRINKMVVYISSDTSTDMEKYLKELNFRNTSGNNVVWSDGSSGVLTTVLNSVTKEVDSFSVTHVNSGLKVRQPAVTRDANYHVTNIPSLIVETI